MPFLVNGICYPTNQQAFTAYLKTFPSSFVVSGATNNTYLNHLDIGQVSPTGLLTIKYYLNGTPTTIRTLSFQLPTCTKQLEFSHADTNDILVSFCLFITLFIGFLVGLRVWKDA